MDETLTRCAHRPLQPALPDLAGDLRPPEGRRDGHRAVQGIPPRLRHERRRLRAPGDPLRRELATTSPRAASRRWPGPCAWRSSSTPRPTATPPPPRACSRKSLHAERRPDRLRVGQPALGREGLAEGRRRPGAARPRSSPPTIRTSIAAADLIVLPGVGAFAACMAALEARAGVIEAMTEAVQGARRAVPRHLRRHAAAGRRAAWSSARRRASTGSRATCAASSPTTARCKVPHMGWNALDGALPTPLFAGLPDGAAHVFHPLLRHLSRPTRPTSPPATDHGGRFAAAVARGNVAGVQFHPEKSQAAGAAAARQLPGVAAVILYPAIDLKDGQCVRVRARRLRHRHGVQRRPGRPGAGLGRRPASSGCTWST